MTYQYINRAATNIQKHLRTYIIRKRFMQLVKVYYFFKKAEMKILTKQLVQAMKDSFINLK